MQTFTSGEFGYQISVPKPWSIRDPEGGNGFELVYDTYLAFLEVRLSVGAANQFNMTELLPGGIGIVRYEQKHIKWEGQPAIRFERNYLATSNGPWFRVEGLIATGKNHIYTIQCGGISPPPDAPPDSNDPKHKLEWTPAVEQAISRIVESFTFGH